MIVAVAAVIVSRRSVNTDQPVRDGDPSDERRPDLREDLQLARPNLRIANGVRPAEGHLPDPGVVQVGQVTLPHVEIRQVDPLSGGDEEPGQVRLLGDQEGRFVLANPVHPGSTQHNPMTISVAAPGQIPIPPRAEVKGVMPGTQDVELVVENFGYDAGGWRVDQHPRFLADTNGNGRADIVGFGNAGVYVSRSQPDGSFGPVELVGHLPLIGVTLLLVGHGSGRDRVSLRMPDRGWSRPRRPIRDPLVRPGLSWLRPLEPGDLCPVRIRCTDLYLSGGLRR